jgi:hypothetical protein
VYSSRPGLRVWLADKNGVVQQTLIYKVYHCSFVRNVCNVLVSKP